MIAFCPLTLGLSVVVGLIVLIAGCVQNSEWNGESEAERRMREAG